MKTKAFLLFLVVLLVTATTVIARRGSRGHGPGGPGGPGGIGRVMHIAEMLELTDEQFIKLRKHMKSTREEVHPLFEQMHLLRRQIIETLDSETFEETKIREILALKAKVMTELAVLHLKKAHEFKKELTPEQLNKVRDMLKRGPHCHHKREE